MALDYVNEYGAAVDNTDLVNYPQGKVLNDAVPGDNTGTPLEKAWWNDFWGFLQRAIALAGITPSNNPDTAVVSQYMNAMEQLLVGRDHLSGLTLSNSTVDTINDLDVAVGEAMDAPGERLMRSATSFTKRIDAVWAGGSSAGGRASGAAALAPGVWYGFFMIMNPTTGAVDFGWDDDPNAVNLLADALGGGFFTLYRRIGWTQYVDGAEGLRKFDQVGNDFIWRTGVIDETDTSHALPTAQTSITLTVPPSLVAAKINWFLELDAGATLQSYGYIVNSLSGNPAPGSGAFNSVIQRTASNNNPIDLRQAVVMSDQVMKHRWSVAFTALNWEVLTEGYTDPRST